MNERNPDDVVAALTRVEVQQLRDLADRLSPPQGLRFGGGELIHSILRSAEGRGKALRVPRDLILRVATAASRKRDAETEMNNVSGDVFAASRALEAAIDEWEEAIYAKDEGRG